MAARARRRGRLLVLALVVRAYWPDGEQVLGSEDPGRPALQVRPNPQPRRYVRAGSIARRVDVD